MECKRANY